MYKQPQPESTDIFILDIFFLLKTLLAGQNPISLGLSSLSLEQTTSNLLRTSSSVLCEAGPWCIGCDGQSPMSHAKTLSVCVCVGMKNVRRQRGKVLRKTMEKDRFQHLSKRFYHLINAYAVKFKGPILCKKSSMFSSNNVSLGLKVHPLLLMFAPLF